jgi:hypothetical protein
MLLRVVSEGPSFEIVSKGSALPEVQSSDEKTAAGWIYFWPASVFEIPDLPKMQQHFMSDVIN